MKVEHGVHTFLEKIVHYSHRVTVVREERRNFKLHKEVSLRPFPEHDRNKTNTILK
jgi:hypothetical protein